MRLGYVLRRKGFTISTSRESPSPPPSAVVDPENSVLIKVSLQTVLPHLAQIRAFGWSWGVSKHGRQGRGNCEIHHHSVETKSEWPS